MKEGREDGGQEGPESCWWGLGRSEPIGCSPCARDGAGQRAGRVFIRAPLGGLQAHPAFPKGGSFLLRLQLLWIRILEAFYY